MVDYARKPNITNELLIESTTTESDIVDFVGETEHGGVHGVYYHEDGTLALVTVATRGGTVNFTVNLAEGLYMRIEREYTANGLQIPVMVSQAYTSLAQDPAYVHAD